MTFRSTTSGLAILAFATLLIAGCSQSSTEDSPQAAFQRWEAASAKRDVEEYFEAIVPPDRRSFLMSVVASWRAGEWRADSARRHDALGAVLARHSLDQIDYPLSFDERARIEGIESLPEVLAEIFEAVDGLGPRDIPMWDLLPQPVSLGEVGAIDEYDSAPASARFTAFDIQAMSTREREDNVRFFRGKDGRWRVSVPAF